MLGKGLRNRDKIGSGIQDLDALRGSIHQDIKVRFGRFSGGRKQGFGGSKKLGMTAGFSSLKLPMFEPPVVFGKNPQKSTEHKLGPVASRGAFWALLAVEKAG